MMYTQNNCQTFKEIGVDVNNGYGNLLSNLSEVSADKRAEIEADLKEAFTNGPALAMVNSDKGITNLHVPSDVIIDASMPAMIRNGGKMWVGNSPALRRLVLLLLRLGHRVPVVPPPLSLLLLVPSPLLLP